MNYQQEDIQQSLNNSRAPKIQLDGVFRKSSASQADCVEVARCSDGTVKGKG